MSKLEYDDAVQWAKENDIRIGNNSEGWSESIFLIKAITLYMNAYYGEDEEILATDLNYAITDETFIHNVGNTFLTSASEFQNDKKPTIMDRKIDALIFLDENEELINSIDSDFQSVTKILSFQAKNVKNPTIPKSEYEGAINSTIAEVSEYITGTRKYYDADSNGIDTPKELIGKLIQDKTDTLKSAEIIPIFINHDRVTSSDALNNVKIVLEHSTTSAEIVGLSLEAAKKIYNDDVNQIAMSVKETESALEERKIKRRANSKVITGDHEIKLASLTNVPFYSEYADSFYAFAYLGDYSKFLSVGKGNFDERLINDNIRGDQGKRKSANKSIIETLTKKDSYIGDFWWLNNGVTIIADKLQQVNPNEIKLTNPQIVNGQQTSRRIFESRDEIANLEWKINLKILVISDNNSNSTRQLRKDIIVGVNTQNPVKVEDVLSLEVNVRSLSQYISVESKEDVKLGVHVGEGPGISHYFITHGELVQFVAAGFYNQSGQARRSKATIVKNYSERVYSEEYTANSTRIIDLWIKLIKGILHFKNCYTTYIDGNDTEGAQYAKFEIFQFLIQNQLNYSSDSNNDEDLLAKMKLVKFSTSEINKSFHYWNEFARMGKSNGDPDGYTKSNDISADVLEFIYENKFE